MKVTLVQSDIVWNEAEINLSRFESQILSAPRSDLYVLPEMFTTGFNVHPAENAECCEGPTLDWMKRLSCETDAALCGSVCVNTGADFRNRLYFVRPDGSYDFYDKHHLFRGESRMYTPGSERVIVEFRGMRFLLAVCYDLRFPVWMRNSGDYDAIIIPASWPEVRRYAWDTLLRARSIENQSYVLGVNRVGEDPNDVYSGGTVALGPSGTVIASVKDCHRGIAVCEISREETDSLRNSCSIAADADRFELV